MKYLFSSILLVVILTSGVFAYSPHNIESANFIALKGIINDNSPSPVSYNLDYNITRREMLKVMINLSGKTVSETCIQTFSDLTPGDWGCKYAQVALDEGYIATNPNFRPDDNITQIEALKMIMQAIGMQRDSNDDWREGYVSKATREKLVDDEYLDYNKNAVRGWIFSNVARSYDDFIYIQTEPEIEPEVEKILDSLFDL